MGTRSMNALVVINHQPTEVAQRFLTDALVSSKGKHAMWIWETNISPIHARHSVTDLQEEVAILGWLVNLPADDFILIRCGSDLGTMGNLGLEDNPRNPFWDVDDFKAMVLQYQEEVAEVAGRDVNGFKASLPPADIGNPTTGGLVLNVPQLFAHPDFQAWLNDGKPKFTWHQVGAPGTPTEWSDVVILVDPSLNGEGSDSDMPEKAWEVVMAHCRQHFKPSQSANHIMVRLTNMEVA